MFVKLRKVSLPQPITIVWISIIFFIFYFDVLCVRSSLICWFICDIWYSSGCVLSKHMHTHIVNIAIAIQRATAQNITIIIHHITSHIISYVCTKRRKIEFRWIFESCGCSNMLQIFDLLWFVCTYCMVWQCYLFMYTSYNRTNMCVCAMRLVEVFFYIYILYTLILVCSRAKTTKRARQTYCVHIIQFLNSICLAPTNTIARLVLFY